MNDNSKCQLYLITPPKFDNKIFSERLKVALGAGPVACLQLRLKGMEDDAVKRAVECLLPICHSHQVPLLVNDRPDLALSTGCDGAHIGQDDLDYGKARSILGSDTIIGVTCKNSRHLALEAAENGAQYVAFGAFFPSKSKFGTTPAELETVKWWSDISVVPSVAIGGITVQNCDPLIKAGIDFIAVIDGVWDYSKGEAKAVIEFNRAFDLIK